MIKSINILALMILSAVACIVLLLMLNLPIEVPKKPRVVSDIDIRTDKQVLETVDSGKNILMMGDNTQSDITSLQPLVNTMVLTGIRKLDGISITNPLDNPEFSLQVTYQDNLVVRGRYDTNLEAIRFVLPKYAFTISGEQYNTEEIIVAEVNKIPIHSIIQIDGRDISVDDMDGVTISIEALKKSGIVLLTQSTSNLLDSSVASFERGAWTEKVADCNITAPGVADISMDIVSDSSEGNNALQLSSSNHPACTNKSFPVIAQSGIRYYLFSDYKATNNSAAQMYYKTGSDAESYQDQRSFQSISETWKTAFFPVVFNRAGEQPIDIYLYASSNGDGYSQSTYDNIRLYGYKKSEEKKEVIFKYEDNQQITLTSNIFFSKGDLLVVSDINKENLLSNQNASFDEGLWTNYVSDCNVNASGDATGLQMTQSNDASDGDYSLQLTSINHPACTNKSFSAALSSDMLYSLSFDYKNIQGRNAKFYYKLRDVEDSDMSRTISALSDTWENSDNDLIPVRDSSGIDIYFYAQASGSEVTTLYDNVKLRSILPAIFTSLQFVYNSKKDKSQYEKDLIYDIETPWRWRMKLENVISPVVLIMPQAYDFGSSLTIGQENVNANLHYKMNGYADSWLIDPEEVCKNSKTCKINDDGSYDIEMVIEFTPQRWFYVGLIISGTTLAGCLGYLGYDFMKRRRKKRNAQPTPPHPRHYDIKSI